MKKIIAFLSALVMTVAMSATVSFAADNEVVFTEKNKTANSVDIEVAIKTTRNDIETIGLCLDVSDALSKGATVDVTSAGVGDTASKYLGAQKMAQVNYLSLSAVKYTSNTVLATINVTNITEDFTISLMPNSGRTKSSISVAGGTTLDLGIFGTIGTSVTMVTAPTKVDPTANVETKTVGTTQGFLASCEVSDATYAINGLTLNFVAGEATAEKAFTFTTIEAGTAMYAVNVTGVEDGVTVTATATPSIVK